MEEQLIGLLLASAGVTALVGNRVRPVMLSQTDTLPALSVQRIDGIRDYNMSGASGMVSSRVQIDCWGATYSASKNTARAVAAVLSGITTPFQGVFLLDEQDGSEDADTARVYRTRLDFQIFHEEPEND